MKINVLRENLAKEISSVSRAAAGSSAAMPILSNVLLDARPDGLRLSATNLDVGVTSTVQASVAAGGGLTVPARLFADIVKSLPGDEIELAADDDILHIRSGDYKANLRGLPADDFPLQAFDIVTPLAHISGAALKSAITGVVAAAEKDDSRPVLTGVRCIFDETTMQLTATDGYRLMQATVAANIFGQPQPVILPAKSLVEVSRIIRPAETVEIGVANGQYVFRMADVVFYCAALAGEFPAVEAIVPSGIATNAVADTEALKQAVQVAYLFAKGGGNILRLELTETALRIETAGLEIGDNISTVDALITGPPVTVGVNAKYMLDALASVSTPQVVLGFNAANRPVTIKPSGGEDNFLAVIMPMTLVNG